MPDLEERCTLPELPYRGALTHENITTSASLP